jgi:ribosomal silencing factor RsfS
MKEIKLTEKQYAEIDSLIVSSYHSREFYTDRLNYAKQQGWIVKDEIETAIEEFIKHSGKSQANWMLMLMHGNNETFHCFLAQYRKAMNIIKLFEDKIKELEE